MYEVLDPKQVRRKLNSETKETHDTTEIKTNSAINSNAAATNNCLNFSDYFIYSANKETDKRVSRLLTLKINDKFSDIFTVISCSKGTFRLWVRKGSFPYQDLPRRVAYELQEPL